MVLEEKYRQIICKMTKISITYIKSYLTDFTIFDIPLITAADNSAVIFFT